MCMGRDSICVWDSLENTSESEEALHEDIAKEKT